MEDDGHADTSTYHILIPWYNNEKNRKFFIVYINYKYIGRSPYFPL